jgi:hypothetical protein
MRILLYTFFSLYILILAPAAQALGIDIVQSNYSRHSGYGFGLELDMNKTFGIRFLVSVFGKQRLSAAPFSLGGNDFAEGTIEVSAYTAELQAYTRERLFGFNGGLSSLIDLLYGQDATNTPVAFPANGYIGAFVSNRQTLFGILSGYGEAGYLLRIIDGEKELNNRISPARVDLGNLDKSGFYTRIGISYVF